MADIETVTTRSVIGGAQIAGPAASATQISVVGDGNSRDPLKAQGTELTVTAAEAGSAGMPVYGPADAVLKASGFGFTTARVLGLVHPNPDYPSDRSFDMDPASPNGCRLVCSGPLTLTTAQWDAITGQSGGLSTANYYYLSLIVGSGGLRNSRPGVGEVAMRIGLAISSTTLLVQLGEPGPGS